MEQQKYTEKEEKLLLFWSNQAKKWSNEHRYANNRYQKYNNMLTIPIIILSTLSGTAGFSMQNFPSDIRGYVPLVIGGIISIHNSSAIQLDKFSRNIIAELTIPVDQRSTVGAEFIQMCKKDMDHIREQQPHVKQLEDLFLDNNSHV